VLLVMSNSPVRSEQRHHAAFDRAQTQLPDKPLEPTDHRAQST
jgi:hypothetical protein